MSSLFCEDLAFLKKYIQPILLQDEQGRALIISAEFQARVMTSTWNIEAGLSPGWINYQWFEQAQVLPHINAMGGEERLWLGPEGGQFSWFFKPNSTFNYDNWQTPKLLDTDSFEILNLTSKEMTAGQRASLQNASGKHFEFGINRKIELLTESATQSLLGINDLNSFQWVSYRSTNKIQNCGNFAWTEETGMPSIWILNMLKHSGLTSVLAPLKMPHQGEPQVNDEYFGKIPSNRLKVIGNSAFFCADGQFRSKLGINSQTALDRIGSIDPLNKILTIVIFDRPVGAPKYVNSMWEIQADPFSGDVINSYNDGPSAEGGKPIGPFYELENSSPALSLSPNEIGRHSSQTIHLQGPLDNLIEAAKQVLKVDASKCLFADFWHSKGSS